MSTYPGEDPQPPQDEPADAEHTAPITPSGPVWNPTSAQTFPEPTTAYERPPYPPYGQTPPPPYGQTPPPPYVQTPPPPYGQFTPPVPNHSQSTLSLVLGIVGLVGALMFCGLPLVVSPFAWALGRNALKEIAASQGQLRGQSEARAGVIMGIIGTVLLGLAVLVMIGFAVVLVANVQTV